MIFKVLISKCYQHVYNTTKRKLNLKLFFNGYYSVLIATIKLFF